MSDSGNRLAYIDAAGEPHCVSATACPQASVEFVESLDALARDLNLAADCVSLFQGVPRPVALALLRNLNRASAAVGRLIVETAPAEVH
jgi:hypothetical protein